MTDDRATGPVSEQSRTLPRMPSNRLQRGGPHRQLGTLSLFACGGTTHGLREPKCSNAKQDAVAT